MGKNFLSFKKRLCIHSRQKTLLHAGRYKAEFQNGKPSGLIKSQETLVGGSD